MDTPCFRKKGWPNCILEMDGIQFLDGGRVNIVGRIVDMKTGEVRDRDYITRWSDEWECALTVEEFLANV